MPDKEPKKCSYEGCPAPSASSRFFLINEGKTAGGQDWSSLEGKTLCDKCYCRFKVHGRLDKKARKTLDGMEKKCTYANCSRPLQSRTYHLIDDATSAGSKDWKPLKGNVLCDACYQRFLKKGSLEISRAPPSSPSAKARQQQPPPAPAPAVAPARDVVLDAKKPQIAKPVQSGFRPTESRNGAATPVGSAAPGAVTGVKRAAPAAPIAEVKGGGAVRKEGDPKKAAVAAAGDDAKKQKVS